MHRKRPWVPGTSRSQGLSESLARAEKDQRRSCRVSSWHAAYLKLQEGGRVVIFRVCAFLCVQYTLPQVHLGDSQLRALGLKQRLAAKLLLHRHTWNFPADWDVITASGKSVHVHTIAEGPWKKQVFHFEISNCTCGQIACSTGHGIQPTWTIETVGAIDSSASRAAEGPKQLPARRT